MDKKKYDCRLINDGIVCQHLHFWNNEQHIEYAKAYTCKALNVVLFPNYSNEGRINQQLIRIKPLFHCPVIQDLRMNGLVSEMVASININDYTAWNND